MKVGDRASLTHTFDHDEVADFLELARLDADFTHVPEPLIGGLFSYLLGVKLPGSGTNYLKQELHFHAPAPLGEPLTANVEIMRLRPEKHLCDLSTTCCDSAGNIVCTGRSLVLVKDVEQPAEA